jgi:diguanylate cyclase (GGDEF)-like protein
VLRNIGAIFRHSFRQSDTVGRYGGEEFVVILPEMNLQDARRKLESLRELVANTPIEFNSQGEMVAVTISAGLAALPEDGNDVAELFALADERLFQAKREGRNRVVASPEPVLS